MLLLLLFLKLRFKKLFLRITNVSEPSDRMYCNLSKATKNMIRLTAHESLLHLQNDCKTKRFKEEIFYFLFYLLVTIQLRIIFTYICIYEQSYFGHMLSVVLQTRVSGARFDNFLSFWLWAPKLPYWRYNDLCPYPDDFWKWKLYIIIFTFLVH